MIAIFKYSFLIFFLVYSYSSSACFKSEIPYSVKRFEKEENESEKDPFAFSISVPNTYKEWKLDLIFYRLGNSHIPMSTSSPDENNYVTANFFSSLESLKNAKVEAIYKLIPEKEGNLSLCTRYQVIDFGI